MNEIPPEVIMIKQVSITIHRKNFDKEADTYIDTENIVDNVECSINIKESNLNEAVQKLLEDKAGNDWIFQGFNPGSGRPNHFLSYTFQDSNDNTAVVGLLCTRIDLHNAIHQRYEIANSIDV